MIVPNICDCISMVAPSYRHLRNRTPHPNPSRSCIALARRSYARASSRTHSPPWPKTGIPDHGPQASHAPGPEDPPAKGPRQPKPLSSHMLRPSHHSLRGGAGGGPDLGQPTRGPPTCACRSGDEGLNLRPNAAQFRLQILAYLQVQDFACHFTP